MIVLRGRPVSIMVLFAVALHLTWAVLLAVDDSTVSVNAVHALYVYVRSVPILIGMTGGAALMALAGIFTEVPWIVLLLIPQQVLLMMSAAGAVESAWLGQFADGVLRPHAFVAADQVYSVFAAIGHTAAVIAHARRITR